MPPCSETTHAAMEDYYLGATPRKNIVFAVNYELSMVDQFTLSQKKKRRRSSLDGIVEETLSEQAESTRMESRPDASNVSISDNSEPDLKTSSKSSIEEEEEDCQMYRASSPVPLNSIEKRHETRSPTSVRKSTRERPKREVPLARARVRYDMQMVPAVNRNRFFLQYFFDSQSLAPRRSSRLQVPKESDPESESDDGVPPPPFADGNTTVVWIPTKRSEWEDSISEMTAVCTSAAIRRYVIDAASSSNNETKPFHAPLSREYIRDRVDIDDPLRGYQLCSVDEFHDLDSLLQVGLSSSSEWFPADQPASGKADITGELANELELQPRSGDPRGEGVVFEGIAELALLGGLGCGEILLRMALESIVQTGKYNYLVLQATDSSKTFYERFGFIRVGAVCRYEKQIGAHETEPIQGYRHWTHANESEKSLQKHGGPSYMMCLKLTERGTKNAAPSFLNEMMKLAVENKPTVDPLGATGSVVKSSVRKGSSSDFSSVTPKRARGRPPLSASGRTPASRRKSVGRPPSQVIVRTKNTDQSNYHKHALPPAAADQPPLKRRRISEPDSPIGSMKLVPSPSSDSGVLLGAATKGAAGGITPKKRMKREAASDESQARKTRFDFPLPEPLKLSRSQPKTIDKTELMKQKVKAYPRSRVHYYNRVVKSKEQSKDKQYFFVLQYDESTNLIKIVPLTAKSVLTGKREGRPRYQADIGDTDENFAVVRADDYNVVSAAMVMKTPVVAAEAWDVEDD